MWQPPSQGDGSVASELLFRLDEAIEGVPVKE
jgi:hypothetical protein